MVELRCSVVSVGMVVGRPGSPWCRQPVGRRSRIDPCMPGCFDVGWIACGLFMVASWLPQLFGWCMGVLAALWSAFFIVSFFLLLLALSRPRSSCGRHVCSGPLRAKVCVGAARYGELLWPWGRGFEVGRCGWLVGC